MTKLGVEEAKLLYSYYGRVSFKVSLVRIYGDSVGVQVWVEKFVLILCYLRFKVPEFVLLLTLRNKLISF